MNIKEKLKKIDEHFKNITEEDLERNLRKACLGKIKPNEKEVSNVIGIDVVKYIRRRWQSSETLQDRKIISIEAYEKYGIKESHYYDIITGRYDDVIYILSNIIITENVETGSVLYRLPNGLIVDLTK